MKAPSQRALLRALRFSLYRVTVHRLKGAARFACEEKVLAVAWIDSPPRSCVKVLAVFDGKGRTIALSDWCPAERFGLYEAIREEERKR